MSYPRPILRGDVLREARLRRGLTQDDVAELCKQRTGRLVNNLGRMENGDIKRPSPRILPVLAEVLGLEVSDLLEIPAHDEPALAAAS